MEVRFAEQSLQRLESDASFNGGFGQEIVKAFRKRMQMIRAARDERDFYALKSLHFEKLKGDRQGQYSMRLNQQWRLILEFERQEGSSATVVIISIVDYH
jgi:proteic killer suppression protein